MGKVGVTTQLRAGSIKVCSFFWGPAVVHRWNIVATLACTASLYAAGQQCILKYYTIGRQLSITGAIILNPRADLYLYTFLYNFFGIQPIVGPFTNWNTKKIYSSKCLDIIFDSVRNTLLARVSAIYHRFCDNKLNCFLIFRLIRSDVLLLCNRAEDVGKWQTIVKHAMLEASVRLQIYKL